MQGFSHITARLPLDAGDCRCRALGLDGLIALWRISRADYPERATCRPVPARSAEEMAAFYVGNMETTLHIGLFTGPALMGKISLSDYNPRNRSCELGYYLAPDYRGAGRMRRALETLLPVVFAGPVNKVYAQTGRFNRPSVRLLEVMGFQLDGVLREHHELDGVLCDDAIYSLLKGEYLG